MSYIQSRKHAVARQPRHRSTVALAAAALALPGAVLAQSASAPAAAASQPKEATLPVVKVQAQKENEYKADVVSSPKFTEPLLDTPQTIVVIKKELMQQQGATTLTEALRATPGVGTFALGENGSTNRGDAIYMRGFDASGSIFVDGIRNTAPISRDVFNIDQVEVEKGPAGTDNGHGSPSGSVNLVSKQAEAGNFGSASATIGEWNQNRAVVDVNRQFSADVAGRVTVMGQMSGVAGRDKVENNRWGVAPTVTFGLGSKTTFKLSGLYVEQDNVPDGGVPTVGLPGYVGSSAALSAAPKVRPTNFYGTNSDYEHNSLGMGTLAIEHTFDNKFVLRNTSRISETADDYLLTSFMAPVTPSATSTDYAAFTIVRTVNNLHQNNVVEANQTTLTGEFTTGAVRHAFSAGLEFTGEAQRAKTLASVAQGTATTANLYDPQSNVDAFNRNYTGARTEGKTGTASGYAFDTLHFGDSFLLTGGVRLDHYRTHFNSLVACGGTARGAVACPTGVATGSIITGVNLESTGNLFGWKLGGVYKPTADGSLYANYAVSAQPPGGTNFTLAATGTSGASNVPGAQPEKSRTAEVGVKWNFLDDQLGITADLYRTEIRNDIESDGSTPAQYFQTGKKRVQGVEVAVVGNVTENWAVTAGFTTMNTAITSGASAAADTSSLALNYTPKVAFSSWTTYKLPFGLIVGGGANYNDKLQRQSDSAVGTPKYVNSYWVANGMLEYPVNKSLDLRLNVYNLFDRDYASSINKSGYRYTPGAPRYTTLSATLQF